MSASPVPYSPLKEEAGETGGDVELSNAAKSIQHIFKRHRIVFGRLGATIFARKGGAEADYGELYFPSSGRKSPFITVSDTTSITLLSSFIELYWKVHRPEVLISVTGGAQDFSLPAPLQRAFDRGATGQWRTRDTRTARQRRCITRRRGRGTQHRCGTAK